jgi:hypothetical protein
LVAFIRKEFNIINRIVSQVLRDTLLRSSAKMRDLAHPPVFLPETGVNPLRGFIRPALRANGINARKGLEIRFSLETHAAKL